MADSTREGIMALQAPEMRNLYDMKVFVVSGSGLTLQGVRC